MSQVRAVFELSKQGIIVADTGTVSNLYVFYFPFTAFQPNQEDEQMQRPEVREEDLTETKNKLGAAGPPKSKTMEVMEECEKMGKVAPSVFSRARSGAETAFNTRSGQPIRK
uniref:Musculoskeletal embryonic nuclear protein 1 n=1 Tax=Pundamilia nyererei TaxID=303518 RepID=A0A3B4FA28_9CICH